MRTISYIALLAALFAGTVPCQPARGDEIDQLVKKLSLRRRWQGYKPRFHHTTHTFTFEDPGRSVKRTWRLAMDGPRYVGLMPDDHIQLLGLTVGTAPTKYIPPARYLPELFLGPVMTTGSLIPHKVQYRLDGSSNIMRSDSLGVGGSSLTLTRVSPRGNVLVIKKYTFSVDEQLGYMITADVTVTFRRPNPATKQLTTDLECSGSFQPWPDQWVYDATVLTPGGTNEIAGYSNNTAAMLRLAAASDRSAGDEAPVAADRTGPAPLTLRDGGFVAWLHRENSWSPCRSFTGLGRDANMTLDPTTNRLRLTVEIPPEFNNDPNRIRRIWKFRERQFTLPPEMTEHLRRQAKSLMPAGGGLVLRIGQTEDFEDQPIAYAKPIRGPAWSEKAAPKLLTDRGASGKKCLLIDGPPQVNVPWTKVAPDFQRVLLQPDTKYVIEATMKVRDFSRESRQGYRDAYDKHVRKIKEQELETPDFQPLLPHAQAYVLATLISSPTSHMGPLARHKTTLATAENPAWQKLRAEFTTPDSYTYLHLSFVCHSGSAMLDDLTVKKATP